MKTVVTHSEGFHADDVFAMATLQLVFGKENLSVKRSRDNEVIATADIVFDIGGVYDHEKLRYDHHQPGAPVRENGVPYAAFGLVWKHYGPKLCSPEVVGKIDESMCQPIDAGDNGIHVWEKGVFGLEPLFWDWIVKSFRSADYDAHENDERFFEIVDFARRFLEIRVAKETKKVADREEAEAFYATQTETEILISDKAYGRNYFIPHEEVKVLVSPRNDEPDTDWAAVAVQIEEDRFPTRVSFPESWRGLHDDALATASGLEDAIFCHKDGYLFISGSKETAVEAAKQAVLAGPKES